MSELHTSRDTNTNIRRPAWAAFDSGLQACGSPEPRPHRNQLTIRARTRILPGSMLRLLGGPPADAPLGHAFSTRPRGREPGPPPATRHPGRSTTPRHPTRRSGLLDPAAPLLERLGREPHHRPASHGRALAPRRLPHLLELAVQARHALRPPGRWPASPLRLAHGRVADHLAGALAPPIAWGDRTREFCPELRSAVRSEHSRPAAASRSRITAVAELASPRTDRVLA